MKHYKTVQGMAKQTNQLTLQAVLNGKMYHNNKGWVNVSLHTRDKVIKDVIKNIIGGNKQDRLLWILRDAPQHWALARILYSTKRKNFSYCAGQDYPRELNQLRKYLYSL